MLVPKRPCKQGGDYRCPWVKDTPPGEFSRERYEELRNTSPDPEGLGPDWGAPMFACHKSPEGKEYVCAGWLATQGHRHPGVRFNLFIGGVSACQLSPRPEWPELYDNYEEMKEAKQGDG